jgi:hypothetical protein
MRDFASAEVLRRLIVVVVALQLPQSQQSTDAETCHVQG